MLLNFPLSSVQILFLRSRPAAITRAIWPVVIDPIKRVGRGRLGSHVSEERLKALEPSGVYCYSSPSITRVDLVGQAGTSRFHPCPGMVFRGIRQAVSCELLPSTGYRAFCTQASAGESAMSNKAVTSDRCGSAAVAQASPPHPMDCGSLNVNTHDGQTLKATASELVLELSHAKDYIKLRRRWELS